jgi:hypothetical protein
MPMDSEIRTRRLVKRIDKLEDRLHNDYKTLIGEILHLDAHVSRLETELARALHLRALKTRMRKAA